MKLRKLLKILFSKSVSLENFCKDCGRKCEAFRVDNWLWVKAIGGFDHHKEFCFACFDRRARQQGLYPVWDVRQAED